MDVFYYPSIGDHSAQQQQGSWFNPSIQRRALLSRTYFIHLLSSFGHHGELEMPGDGVHLIDTSYMLESIIDKERQLSVFADKLDNRLFPEYKLYCEGLEKPTLRGAAHLLYSLVLPFLLWHLFVEADGSVLGQTAAILYVTGNLWSYGASALYHVGRWSVRTEILLQKIDHCGIAAFAAGTNMPVALLLLPSRFGIALAGLSVAACIWNCWHICKGKPSIVRLTVASSVIAAFWPVLYFHMNYIEFGGMMANSFFMCMGMLIFVHRYPNPWPNVFGYHEIFHVFTILGAVSIYLCNWSVIRRTCQPYDRYTDVLELLLKTLGVRW